MCWYMPNRTPCTCTFMQLIQPCPQVRLFPSPNGNPAPLIQVCPTRYIARGVGQRFCPLCSGAGVLPDTAEGLVGYPAQYPQQQQIQQREGEEEGGPLLEELLSGALSVAGFQIPGDESRELGAVEGDVQLRDESRQGVSSGLEIQSSSDMGLVGQSGPVDEGRDARAVASAVPAAMDCGERDVPMDQADSVDDASKVEGSAGGNGSDSEIVVNAGVDVREQDARLLGGSG